MFPQLLPDRLLDTEQQPTLTPVSRQTAMATTCATSSTGETVKPRQHHGTLQAALDTLHTLGVRLDSTTSRYALKTLKVHGVAGRHTSQSTSSIGLQTHRLLHQDHPLGITAHPTPIPRAPLTLTVTASTTSSTGETAQPPRWVRIHQATWLQRLIPGALQERTTSKPVQRISTAVGAAGLQP